MRFPEVTEVTVGDAGTVLLTTNGGSNWNNQLHLLYSAPFTQGFALYSTYFADNSTGWSGRMGRYY